MHATLSATLQMIVEIYTACYHAAFAKRDARIIAAFAIVWQNLVKMC